PSTTDRNPRILPAGPCRQRSMPSPRAIPSLQPTQARLTEQRRPTPPSRITPTVSKPRSRSTNSYSACASSSSCSSSNKQTRLNSLLYHEKKGSPKACPKNLSQKPEQNLALHHLCHHAPGLISRRHLPDMHLKRPKHCHTN